MTTETIKSENRLDWRKEIQTVRHEVRDRLDMKKYVGADPWRSMALALGTHGAILCLAGVSMFIGQQWGDIAGVASVVAVVPFIARSQRVLELLVHDGSHYSFAKNKQWNDSICDTLAGASVAQITSDYRRTHSIHHSQFGSDQDPCRDRPAMAFMRGRQSDGITGWVKRATRALPQYLREYYGAVTSGTGWRPWAAFAAWHSVYLMFLAAIIGAEQAAVLWMVYWAAPFFLVLPFLRMQAEADEHNYAEGCEAVGTYTNMGWLNRWYVHPGGDAYHLAHHAFPSISLSRLGEFDRAAREVSVRYRSMPIRFR